MKNIFKTFLSSIVLLYAVEGYTESNLNKLECFNTIPPGISDYSEINKYIASSFDINIYKNFFDTFSNWPIDVYLTDQYIYNQQYQTFDTYVEPIGDPVPIGIEKSFVGSNTFINKTQAAHTYHTSSYTRDVTITNTTSIMNGWKVAATGKFKVPFAGSELTLEYNGSVTTTTSTSETNSYTATSQDVYVPGNTIAKVTVYLNVQKVKGKFNFYTKLKGNVSVFFNAFFNGFIDQPNNQGYVAQINVFDLLEKESKSHDLPENIQLDSINHLVLLKGQGEYIVETGTDFTVVTEYIDKNTNKVLKTSSYNL